MMINQPMIYVVLSLHLKKGRI